MFSSRNIHFAILGIILGASTGYILAFYQVQSSMPRARPSPQTSNAPAGHPNVSREELLAMFKDALAENPNNPELMTRYANFLFDMGRFNESVEWFRKAIAIEPNNLDFRTDLGTALWNAGQKDQGMAEYQHILKLDPKHMATLHNLVIVYIEEHNIAAAEQVLEQMEAVDPRYEGLEPLKKRLAEVK
jgi:cytochrome c-type biogenesis protein CcmH/NrfG